MHVRVHRRIHQVLPHLDKKDFDLLGRPTQASSKRPHSDSLQAIVDDAPVVEAYSLEAAVLGPRSDRYLFDLVSNVDKTCFPYSLLIFLRRVHVNPKRGQSLLDVGHHLGGRVVRVHGCIVTAIYPAKFGQLDPTARLKVAESDMSAVLLSRVFRMYLYACPRSVSQSLIAVDMFRMWTKSSESWPKSQGASASSTRNLTFGGTQGG